MQLSIEKATYERLRKAVDLKTTLEAGAEAYDDPSSPNVLIEFDSPSDAWRGMSDLVRVLLDAVDGEASKTEILIQTKA